MSDSRKIIQAARNTYYINYTFDTANQVNNTAGFTITFPTPILNIKANNAFISVEKLAYLNYGADIGDDVPVLCVQTNIPTSSCIDASQNPGVVRTTGYFENIIWDDHFDDAGKAFREAYMYRNNNIMSKTLCSNPSGSTYNLQFFQFQADGARLLSDFQGGGANPINVNTIALTLKVELVEEEIL
jgi:hypothetical protein